MGKIASYNNKSRLKKGPQAAAFHAPALAHYEGTTEQLVKALKPAAPLYILVPEKLEETAAKFVQTFPGKALYAVKTNPAPAVIKHLARGGICHFDVASIEEVRLVRAVAPQAELYFMHPVKAPEAIREAYHDHGVRHFVIDTEEELYKLVRETGLAQDLRVHVRLCLPKNEAAAIDFSSKFGAAPALAAHLLKKSRSVAEAVGLCFHVGTQTASAEAYARAVAIAADVIKTSGVKVDTLNVGGGFPVPYPGQEDVPTLEDCVAAITAAMAEHEIEHLPLLSEPGRYLSALAGALVVRVELRKDDTLYINDGTYGGLFDAGPLVGSRFPVKAVRAGTRKFDSLMTAFSFAGPTCDSLDMMEGPFILPSDIKAGDWIVIGHMGAYSQGLRTNFNGFGHADTVLLSDAPADKQALRKAKKDRV